MLNNYDLSYINKTTIIPDIPLCGYSPLLKRNEKIHGIKNIKANLMSHDCYDDYDCNCDCPDDYNCDCNCDCDCDCNCDCDYECDCLELDPDIPWWEQAH